MATIILKAGRNLDKTYYKGTCPECGLIGAFKESEADKKSFYATGAISYVYFTCPNCNHILQIDASDRIDKKTIDAIIKGDIEV